jgi:aspartate aminotransferase
MIQLFKRRRDVMVDELRKIKGVEVWRSRGAFYVYPNIGKVLQELGMSVEQFADRLLEEKHVVVLPGTLFSESELRRNFIRLSFALDEKLIVEGIQRIKQFVEEKVHR